MNLLKKYGKFWRLAFSLLFICSLSSSCQQSASSITQLKINDVCIEEYEFDCITLGLEGCKLVVQCEEGIASKPTTKPKKKKRKIKESSFKKHVRLFLELMQEGKIEEAAKYSTQYGLKSFLNFNIDKIETFSIRKAKSDDVLGTIMVKINKLPEKVFYFNRQNNQWTFIGTDDWRNS